MHEDCPIPFCRLLCPHPSQEENCRHGWYRQWQPAIGHHGGTRRKGFHRQTTTSTTASGRPRQSKQEAKKHRLDQDHMDSNKSKSDGGRVWMMVWLLVRKQSQVSNIIWNSFLDFAVEKKQQGGDPPPTASLERLAAPPSWCRLNSSSEPTVDP